MRTLLIVEDDAALRAALAERLTNEKFTVLQAENGQEGLAIVEKEHPDLVLLDVEMPRMDGMTMLKTLRGLAGNENIKVIMLTNTDSTDKVAESLEYGAYDFLIKSDWKLSDVVEKVQSVLGPTSPPN